MSLPVYANMQFELSQENVDYVEYIGDNDHKNI